VILAGVETKSLYDDLPKDHGDGIGKLTRPLVDFVPADQHAIMELVIPAVYTEGLDCKASVAISARWSRCGTIRPMWLTAIYTKESGLSAGNAVDLLGLLGLLNLIVDSLTRLFKSVGHVDHHDDERSRSMTLK
jgi:hypothetical protein